MVEQTSFDLLEYRLKGLRSMSTIWVTTQVPGFHYWSEAPDSVSFLKNEHRHLFHIRLFVDVEHDDRDVEFFTLKTELESYLKMKFGIPAYFGQKSCEMIARCISEYFEAGGYNVASVEVSEDGENGAIVYE